MNIKDSLGITVFVLAVAFLAFLLGSAITILKVFPYTYINSAFSAVGELVAMSNEGNTSGYHFLYQARYDGDGVTTHDVERTQPGLTLLSSHWPREDRLGSAIRLIDAQGQVLNEWQIDPEEIWPESPHDDYSTNKYNKHANYVHGSFLMPNGDVIFNIEYLGLLRMDSCGKIMWKLPYRTHHSVDRDDKGNFWVAGLKWRESRKPNYPHLKPPFVDETLLKVSPDGKILEEIFITEAMYDSGYASIFADIKAIYDYSHMNDVEVLDAAMADSFSVFEAGDIVVSMRNLSLIVVMDGLSRKIKWYFRHPLIHQHDPDFEADGTIVVFDNQDDTTRDGSLNGRTRLLKIDPLTKHYEVVYPLSNDQPLYTQEGGKHQLLSNGNRLITETNPGRVFEVTPGGETVWNWQVEQTDSGYVPEVLEGTRYPASYAETAICAAD